VLRAAGLAARDVTRAHSISPRPEGDASALSKARKRLTRRLAKASERNVCAAPVDVDPVWDLAQQFGVDMSALVVSPLGLTGTWTLTGGPIAGECADGTPVFADAVRIVNHDGYLDVTSSPGYGARLDGPGFEGTAVYGAIDCGTTGFYDLNLTITGERLTPSTYHVTQRYARAVIFGTCPVCDVTWAGTMTRALTPALTR
jgi:hypothetical protein